MKRLTDRQKKIVKKLKANRIPVYAYHRKGNKNKISIHNPLKDSVERARVNDKKARKYPQAFDTKRQVDKLTKARKLIGSKKRKKVKLSLKDLLP